MDTAVIVQAMVFGNLNNQSGTGVESAMSGGVLPQRTRTLESIWQLCDMIKEDARSQGIQMYSFVVAPLKDT
eukprot:gene1481-1959_t